MESAPCQDHLEAVVNETPDKAGMPGRAHSTCLSTRGEQRPGFHISCASTKTQESVVLSPMKLELCASKTPAGC